MKPRHTAEQSTVKVNKAQAMGKMGFGAIRDLKNSELFKEPSTEPVQSGEVITVQIPEKELVESAPLQSSAETAEERQPILLTLEDNAASEPSEPAPVPAEAAPKSEKKDKVNVYIPEDPQSALICDSCQ
jgi:hypothetical protein